VLEQTDTHAAWSGGGGPGGARHDVLEYCTHLFEKMFLPGDGEGGNALAGGEGCGGMQASLADASLLEGRVVGQMRPPTQALLISLPQVTPHPFWGAGGAL
jgi:hypothetical protein